MAASIGVNKVMFLAEMKNGEMENAVRTAWKYTCSSK